MSVLLTKPNQIITYNNGNQTLPKLPYSQESPITKIPQNRGTQLNSHTDESPIHHGLQSRRRSPSTPSIRFVLHLQKVAALAQRRLRLAQKERKTVG